MSEVVTTVIPYGPDLFYETPFGLFIPDHQIPSNHDLTIVPMELVNGNNLPFSIHQAHNSGVKIGYVIRPLVHYKTLGTGVLIYYNSWFQSAKPLRDEEVFLSLKFNDLYAFTAINKLTVITTPELSDGLHDYLTML